MKCVKTSILIVLLAVLLAPSMQHLFGGISSAPLKGYFQINPYPSLTLGAWIKKKFQSESTIALNDRIGFKSNLVRLYNQVDFSLFHLPHAGKILVGKEGYLLAEQYLDAYLGLDYVGASLIREKVDKFSLIQTQLWEKHHQLLLLIFPPDKGTFYPEFIPERFLHKKRPETNYSRYKKELQKSGVNFIDFNSYFLMLKDSSNYVLYPKTGIHWSNYGAMLAGDSLSRYIGAKLDMRLPLLVIDSIVLTDELRSPDDDMGKTLNLIWEIPHPEMAYPLFHFDTSQERKKVNALVIGDSFYWNWYHSGYIQNTFENEAFWYYNKDAYPEHFTQPTTVWDINRQEVIAQADVIIILLVNAGYGNIGYGILDELASYLGMEDPRIAEIMERIKNSPEWMDALGKKAKERNIALHDMMVIDARFIIDQQLKGQ
ncbi:MAG: hypothetical protein HQ542_01195 [Bacteroidia bacterium]|nr:hypothetical protein [Bacteroidia bacterium]